MINKNTKFKTGMFDTPKMKIINKLKERDLIFYLWFRIVDLATAIGDNGYLYITKNIPYTIKTLSIEFDRECEEISLALDIMIKLEMIELINNKIFKVKNWTKYQKGMKVQTCETEEDSNINSIDKLSNNSNANDTGRLKSSEQLKNILDDNNVKTNLIDEKNIEENEPEEENKPLESLVLDDKKAAEKEKDKGEKITEPSVKTVRRNTKRKKSDKKKNKKSKIIKDDFGIIEETYEEACRFEEGPPDIKDGTVITSFVF